MTRTTIGTLAGLALAAFLASRFEGPMAMGVLGGYLFGASIGMLGASWQRHVARTRPERIMSAVAVSFLFKVVGVLLGALALRFVDEIAAIADWKSFIVSYTLAAFVCLLCGAVDNARTLKESAL